MKIFQLGLRTSSQNNHTQYWVNLLHLVVFIIIIIIIVIIISIIAI